jgi:hypothetical protein
MEIFVIILSPSKQISTYYLELGHSSYLRHPPDFIVHYHSIIRRWWSALLIAVLSN